MNQRLTIASIVLLAVGPFISGCSSIPTNMAAPVPLKSHSGGKSQLEKGRSAYVSFMKCAMCHRPKPVYDYDPDTWKTDILPRMSGKARLNSEEYAAVLAYVTSDVAQSRPTNE